MLSLGAHRGASRTALVLVQLIIFVTYIFGPAVSSATDPTPEPTPTESAAESTQATEDPAATPAPTSTEAPPEEPTASAAPTPSLAPAESDPTQAPSSDPEPSAPIGTPTLSSDKADYPPGALVTLTGTNWQPGESIHLVVNDDHGSTWRLETWVFADEHGVMTMSFNLPDWFVAVYTAIATGEISGTASTQFTDGNVKVNSADGRDFGYSWTLYQGDGCTGTVKSSGTDTATSNGGTVGVGNNESILIVANSSYNGAPTSTFLNWTFPANNQGESVQLASGSTTTRTICIVGFQNGSRDIVGHYSGANTAPVAANDSYTTDEDTELNVAAPGVLANDTDTEGTALSAVLVAGPAHGSLTLNADGSFSYTPNANFHGSDSFTYKANDGALDSNVATVSITVNPVNDAPTATNDAYSTDEDETLNVAVPGVLGNDTDVEGTVLSAILVAGPSHGSLTLNANGSFSYTPSANFHGSDSFTYKANDGDLDSNVATVSITVNAVNDAPIVTLDGAETSVEGAPESYSFAITDVDSATFTVDDTTCGDHGTASSLVLDGDEGSFDCTWADNHDDEVVSVAVSDGAGGTDSATITVDVANADPVVSAAADQTANEGASTSFTLGSFSDAGVDDDPWSVTIDWGDSSTDTEFDSADQGDLGNASHAYDDDGVYTVSVSVTDKDGGFDSDTFDVTVANVAPTATFTASTPVDEGSAIALSLADPFDPSAADTTAGFEYRFDCGDGAGFGDWGDSASASCPTTDDGTRTVAGEIRDKDGGTTPYSAEVTIANVPPVVTPPAVDAAENQGATEGTARAFLLGSFTDPGADSPWAVSVNWGDGSDADTYSRSSTGSLGTETHTYADNGTFVVTVTVTDKDGGTDSDSFSVTVANVAPTATFSASSPITEGGSSTLSLAGPVDPSSADTTAGFHYSFSCSGDPLVLASSYALAGSEDSATCAFADDGSYLVLGRILDKDGGFTDYDATVVVDNADPVVTAAADQAANEGSSTSFELGSFTDAGLADGPWSVSVDWGDGSTDSSFTTSTQGSLGSLDHTYADNGTHTVTVSVTDKDGGNGSASFTVAVANVAPTATFNAPTAVVEGSPIALSLTDPSDPSSTDTAAGFEYRFDCGDGFGDWGTDSTASCPTVDDGSRSVAGEIRDKDGGSTEYSATVTITNANPLVTAAADQAADEGDPTSFDLGSFSDAGVDDDPWSVSVDWGDGSTDSSFTVSTQGSLGTASHTYADNTTPPTTGYVVTVTVTDKDGGSHFDTFVVVVDNADPTASNPTFAYDSVAGLAEATVDFTDPGWLDIHYADFTWIVDGIEVPSADTLEEEYEYPDSTGTATSKAGLAPGCHTIKITATISDGDGGSDTITVVEQTSVDVYLATFDAPIKQNERNITKWGNVVPIKVRLVSSCTGLATNEPNLFITVAKGTTLDTFGDEVIVSSVSAADSDNQMLRTAGPKYMYNLTTKGWTKGTNYEVRIRAESINGPIIARAVLYAK